MTDLSRGVTARSDKFSVWKWLGPLAKDYCTDLVQDSTEALMKLENLANSGVAYISPLRHNLKFRGPEILGLLWNAYKIL